MAAVAAAATAGVLAAASYLDAKYHLRHDYATLFSGQELSQTQQYISQRVKQDRLLMYHVLEEQAAKPDIGKSYFLMFPSDGRTWTYQQFVADVNRVGNWMFQELGINSGEIVALDGPNSPEYLIIWFALDSIGACPSFLNFNLTGAPLEHCLKLCEARYCFADTEIEHLVAPIQTSVPTCRVIYYTKDMLASLPFPTTPPPAELRSNISPTSLRYLVFTSGTTGLPKAVLKRTATEAATGRNIALTFKLRPGLRYYTCLPLFHGAAHSLCVTAVIHAGSTVVLGRKFSHATFWPEVVSSEAVMIQYVGELCRYLANSQPHPLEKSHKVQVACGNGMRPDVWEPFRQRFNIPVIHELYAATDGLSTSFNPNRGEFSRNAIGVRGILWDHFRGSAEKLVKIDLDSHDMVRDPKTGLVVVCSKGEAGEMVHQVDPKQPEARFGGYFRNEAESKKRYTRDVLKKGDMWFRSGDMMRQDADGRVFFVDRLGDTFRWKSENVSTNEVADLLGVFPGIAECNVYGVLVPNADGRAGCAAIVLAEGVAVEDFDFRGLAQHALKHMARFAVPIFLRITPTLNYTGTMKMQKGKLRSEGCNVEEVQAAGDRLYWLPPKGTEYLPFTVDEYQRLQKGQHKL